MHFYNLFAAIFVVTLFRLCKGEQKCENFDECNNQCSEGMVSYISSCEVMAMSQRTCLQPAARTLGFICDYSRCDCPHPKVLDEAARRCVMPEECSDQTKVQEKLNNNRRRIYFGQKNRKPQKKSQNVYVEFN